MSKGSGRRPEAEKGAFERGWERTFGKGRSQPGKKEQRKQRDRRTRTDQGRETDARDASAGNLVR